MPNIIYKSCYYLYYYPGGIGNNCYAKFGGVNKLNNVAYVKMAN